MLIFIFFFFSGFFSIATASTAQHCSAFPYFQPKNGPLALMNCDFHLAYEQQVTKIIKTFGAKGGRPVIINLGGKLLFKYNGTTYTVNISQEPYHYLKAILHAVFSIYLILDRRNSHITNETKNKFQKINKHLNDLKISSLPISGDQQLTIKKLIIITKNFFLKILVQNYYTKDEEEGYFTKIRPLILIIIKDAAAVEIGLLDKAVNCWLAMLSPTEKQRLVIVVATAHQARAQEISLQYFAQKFHLHYGAGATDEKKLIVLEGSFDEHSALALLARHYIDRQAAKCIFNDATRLQRDLLADAATEILQKWKFTKQDKAKQ